jgi:hypothetical protein
MAIAPAGRRARPGCIASAKTCWSEAAMQN